MAPKWRHMSAACGHSRIVGAHPERGAQQPRFRFTALAVTAEPEQVLRQARRQIVVTRRGARRRGRGAALIDRPAIGRQYPNVLAAAAALHRHDVDRRIGGYARQTAGHDPVARRRGYRIDADAEGAGRESLRAGGAPHRRLRERQPLLGDIGVRPRAQAIDERRRSRVGVEIAAEHRIEPLVGKRRLDDQPLDVLDHVLEGRRLAAPPGRDRRQAQLLAQQPLGDRRHEPHPRRRFEHAAAERIGDRPPCRRAPRRSGPGTPSAESARSSTGSQKSSSSRRRIGVHAAQSAEGLQEQGVAAHRQVVALDQRQPELPRQIGMLEVGLVERARASAPPPAAIRPRPRGAADSRAARRRSRRAAARPVRRSSSGKIARRRSGGSPAHSRVPRASGCDPPEPTSVPSAERDMSTAWTCSQRLPGADDAVAGPQKIRMAERQLRRHQRRRTAVAAGRTDRRAAHPAVGHAAPPRARSRATPRRSAAAAADRAPRDGRGPADRRRRCRSRRSPMISRRARSDAAAHRLGAVTGQSLDQRPPMRAHVAARHQAAHRSDSRRSAYGVKARLRPSLRFAQIECERKLRRRRGSAATCIAPGVWPMRKKRASRRLSASKELTGKVAWLQAARMGHVILAAALRAPHPGVVQIEGQRRVHADGRMQRRRRAARRGSARAPTNSPARAGRPQRHPPAVAGRRHSGPAPGPTPSPAAAPPRNPRSAPCRRARPPRPSRATARAPGAARAACPCTRNRRTWEIGTPSAARTILPRARSRRRRSRRSRRRSPVRTKYGSMNRSCSSVPQRTSVPGWYGVRQKRATSERSSSCCVRLMRACGGISKARISSRPSRPAAPSGEYSLSMQNSARWVLPVTSISRLRSRRSINQGGGHSGAGAGNCPKATSSS